jgi:hypothetical protein
MPYFDSLELTPASAQPGQLFIRDFQTRITPNVTQRNTLIIAGIYIIAIAILWFVFVAFDWPHEADDWLLGFCRHVPYLKEICESCLFVAGAAY